MPKFQTKLGSTCTAAYGVLNMVVPMATTRPSSPATSKGFKAKTLLIICGGKGRSGQAGSERNGSEAAQKGKQKGVRNRERI